MRKGAQFAWGIAVSAMGLALAMPAWAEGAAAGGADQAGDNAAAAKDTAEIIVTAQKRPEKLQEIPVAAAVLSSDTMAHAHVSDLSDINRVVPSVEIKGTFNGRVPYGIRGISTNANEGAIGLTSGVSIQVDGVPVPADSFAVNTITDVSQLEVLKGPQATLGGRTASAGVINFVTYGPTSTPHFAFNAMQTDDGEHHVDARASGPITDTLSYSLAGYYQHTPYPVYNLTLGEKSHADSYGVRGKLKWQITPDFDAQVMGHYARSTSRGENFVPIYFTPGAAFFAPPVGLNQSDMFPGYNINYKNTQYASHTQMGSRYQDKDGALVLNWHLGGNTITSTTSYSHEDQWQTQDVFEGNDQNWALEFENFLYDIGKIPSAMVQPFNNQQVAYGYVRQVTEELKIASDAARPVSYIAGFFYSDMTVNQSEFRNWTLNPLAKTNISTTTNYAIYGRLTAKLAEKVSLVGGLRYNWDNIGWNVSEYFDPAHGIWGDGGFATGGFAWNLHDSSTALVGDIALQYKPSRNLMAYASYTRGYKPKAFNTVHDFSTTQDDPSSTDAKSAQPAAQEHIDSFEVGFKSSLLNRHLTFNLAAFYTKYSGYQAQLFDNSQIISVLVLSNADARTAGLEADLTYVKGNTRAQFSAAYVDAKFTRFTGANCYPAQTAAEGCIAVTDSSGNPVYNASGTAVSAQDLTGKSLPDSPKLKLNASIQQVVPMDRFNVLLGGNISYRTATLLQADQNPATRQPGFALVDLSLGFQTKDEKASLTFFVNNLTNHYYLTNAEDFFASATTGNYVIGQPARDSHRYFGGRLSVAF